MTQTETSAAPAPRPRGQYGQDKWILEVLPNGKTFVEVGAYNGVKHSNTFHLEEMGWDAGVLVEPIFFDALQKNRPSPGNHRFKAYCGESNEGETVMLKTAAPKSSRGRHLKRVNPHAQPALMKVKERVVVPNRRLDSMLEEAGFPEVFDVLTIDVEGAEPEVLKGLGKYRPRVIVLEADKSPFPQALEIILGLGYALAKTFHKPSGALVDLGFIHPDLMG